KTFLPLLFPALDPARSEHQRAAKENRESGFRKKQRPTAWTARPRFFQIQQTLDALAEVRTETISLDAKPTEGTGAGELLAELHETFGENARSVFQNHGGFIGGLFA